MAELIHKYQDFLVAVGVAVVALEGVVRGLQLIVLTLRKLAQITSTKVDDQATGKLADALDAVANGLAWAERVIPRAALGKKKLA